MEDNIITEEQISEELNAWDEAWDDETVGVDAPDEEEPEGEPEDSEEDEAGHEEEDRRHVFTLKVLGEEREVSEEEMRTYAQKGMDYDGVRADRDRYRQENAELGVYKTFLEQIARDSGITLDELMEQTEASMVAKRDGVDQERALERVKYERRIRDLEKKAGDTERQRTSDEKQQADFAAFRDAHPDVKPEEIPKEVWAEVAGGKSLNDAYNAYETKLLKEENRRLKEQAEVKKQEQQNKARSAGSRKSPGSGTGKKDAWDEAWDALM